MKMSLMLSCLILVSACSKNSKQDKRTVTLEKTTETISDEIINTQDSLNKTFQQIRSSHAQMTRNQEFNQLMSEEKHIQLKTRMGAACAYLKNFEYQLWTGKQISDDEAGRTIMYVDAVTEFTRRASDLFELVNIKSMSPINQSRKYKNEQAFYALASCLHVSHHYQDEIIGQKSDLQNNSIYGMVKSALVKEKDRKSLEEHEDVLMNGSNKTLMIELIKARIDIMTTLALSNLTNKNDMNFGQKTKAALFKISGGLIGNIDLPENYNSLNDTTKDSVEQYLDVALEAKIFLQQIDVNKSLEKTLKSAMKEIDFDEKKLSAKEREKQSRDGKKENIRMKINQLLK